MEYDGYTPDPYGMRSKDNEWRSGAMWFVVLFWLLLIFGQGMLLNARSKDITDDIAELRESIGAAPQTETTP